MELCVHIFMCLNCWAPFKSVCHCSSTLTWSHYFSSHVLSFITTIKCAITSKRPVISLVKVLEQYFFVLGLYCLINALIPWNVVLTPDFWEKMVLSSLSKTALFIDSLYWPYCGRDGTLCLRLVFLTCSCNAMKCSVDISHAQLSGLWANLQRLPEVFGSSGETRT